MYGIVDTRSGRVYVTSKSYDIVFMLYESAFRGKWDSFKIERVTHVF